MFASIPSPPSNGVHLGPLFIHAYGLSYVVAEDPGDADALWVTEVWTDQDAWRASLHLPAVQAAIARGRPLIAGFDSRVETNVLGGIGLGGAR